MKPNLIKIALFLLALLLLLQLACQSKEQPQPKPEPAQPKVVLKELRPDRTRAGQVFGRQPDGRSAIVCMTENATQGVIVLFNDEKLETAYGDATWISAFVPKKFYQTPGEIQVQVLDPKTNVKSNSLVFKVEP
jgi:hypothetical protein